MTGCGNQPNQNDSQTIAQLNQNIASLTETVNQQALELETLTKQQDTRFKYLTNRTELAVEQAYEENRYNTAVISPETSGYAILHTPLATILVSTKSVTPYLDGYKIKLELGNLACCDFSGFELHSFTDSHTNDTLFPITNVMTSVLKAASWTPVEFILAPSTPDQVRNTHIAITLNQISLAKLPEQP